MYLKCIFHFIFLIKWEHIWLGNRILKNLNDTLTGFRTSLIPYHARKQSVVLPTPALGKKKSSWWSNQVPGSTMNSDISCFRRLLPSPCKMHGLKWPPADGSPSPRPSVPRWGRVSRCSAVSRGQSWARLIRSW